MKIKEWRETLGLNMASLATKLGCHRSQILRIERGETLPSPEFIERVYRESGGLVGPTDFYDMPPIETVS